MYSTLILAGGMATRLYPITEKIPKSLVMINNKPFIEYQLRYLQKQGIKNVVISIGQFGEMIENCVKNLKNIKLDIEFVFDGKSLLGTGGAVKNSLYKLSDIFFVMYGDSFLPVNFEHIKNSFEYNNKEALMTIFENLNLYDKSNVLYENNKIQEYNKKTFNPKMKHIDYGLSIFSKNIFKDFPVYTNFDLSQVFLKMLSLNELDCFIVSERFYEIGSFQGIKDFENYVNDNT
jgi:N-acetyl-alpha-D-muramate 1-phosphate uridylyltransferase